MGPLQSRLRTRGLGAGRKIISPGSYPPESSIFPASSNDVNGGEAISVNVDFPGHPLGMDVPPGYVELSLLCYVLGYVFSGYY